MPIRVLDAATVGRIAAGEVVERPGSVVKELIENSLDAGATSITVEIKGGGIDYLRVTDNGCGIEAGQVRLAFENHATSKIRTAEQLNDIRTLGFRGEALPSIAAVSRVEMTTRAANQESGMKLTVEGGKDMQTREAGCPLGTTIIMRDLFFNVPVRRGFLKKASYEGGLVSDTVSRMLLGNPDVSMRFISGGNTLYHSFGDGKLRHAVFAVYGRETAEKMMELDASEGGVRIYGLIGVGDLAKATRAHQLFYINGRSVRCPLLSRVLEQVCRGRVTVGMVPMCVLNLVIPSTGVDVNVHPNKLEVRFRDEDRMRESCERLLESAFAGEKLLDMDKAAQPGLHVNRVSTVREIPLSAVRQELPEAKETPVASETQKPPKAEQLQLDLGRAPSGTRTLREGGEPVFRDQPIKTLKLGPQAEQIPEAKKQARDGAERKLPEPSAKAETPKPSEPPKTADRPIETPKTIEKPFEAPKAEQPSAAQAPETLPPQRENKAELPPFRVIGVAFRTYILVETGDTLLLIDQHAAHERLQYEKLTARMQAGTASQQLLVPVIIRLSARELAVIEENIETLADAGYTVEPFGENEIRISAVPFVLGKAELKPIFLDMLHSLSRLKGATLDARRGEIMQMACKSAVKAGDVLSESEIAALLEAMLTTGAPPTCPHGRPVVKTLTRRELEKMFKRIQ